MHPIVMEDVNCDGTESRLTDCPANNYHDCTHAEDAGVICCGAPGENQRTVVTLGYLHVVSVFVVAM